MELFKNLSELLSDGQQMTVTVRKTGHELVVSTMPDMQVKDKAVENIVPIVVKGTPQELDEGYVDTLKEGLPIADGLVTNIKEYEESVELARKATQMAKDEKDQSKKQKEAFNNLIALARKNKDEHKFKDAKAILAKAGNLVGADKSVIKKVEQEISLASGEGNMFVNIEDKSDGADTGEKVEKEEKKDEEDLPKMEEIDPSIADSDEPF